MGMPPTKAPINANCAAKSSSMLNANYSTKSLAFKLTKNNDISYNNVKNVCQPIEQASYQSYEHSVIFTSHATKNTSAQLDLNTYSYNSTCDQFDGNTGNCKFSINKIKDSKKNQETTNVHAMLIFFYYFVLFQK